VRTLRDQIVGVLETKNLDFASESHLTACKSRIDRMLAPRLDEYRVLGGGSTDWPYGR
jgi:hypothetical protein